MNTWNIFIRYVVMKKRYKNITRDLKDFLKNLQKDITWKIGETAEKVTAGT